MRHKSVECPDCGLNHIIDANHVKFEEAKPGDPIHCGECEGGEIQDHYRVGASTLVPIDAIPERYLNADDDHLEREAAGTPYLLN